jgi:hypothetical protein
LSQIYKSLTSGPVPPTVPTQFTADDATIGVPAANNFNLFSRDTSDNNDNGIQTTTDANGSANHYTELTNRMTGAVTTTDATQTTIITFVLPAVAGTYYVFGNVQAYTSTGPAGGSYSFSGGYLTNGAAVTELGTEFQDTFESASFVTADIFLDTSGNNVILSVQGLAGTTINWNSVLEFRQVN